MTMALTVVFVGLSLLFRRKVDWPLKMMIVLGPYYYYMIADWLAWRRSGSSAGCIHRMQFSGKSSRWLGGLVPVPVLFSSLVIGGKRADDGGRRTADGGRRTVDGGLWTVDCGRRRVEQGSRVDGGHGLSVDDAVPCGDAYAVAVSLRCHNAPQAAARHRKVPAPHVARPPSLNV